MQLAAEIWHRLRISQRIPLRQEDDTTRHSIAVTSIALCATLWLTTSARGNVTTIIMNGVPLSYEQIVAYQINLPPGRYWYDRKSGLWGTEGGPFHGQISPNLELGGPMRADASRSKTGVFINGRQIHPDEVRFLIAYAGGPIPLGRYWLLWNGAGGLEGQPQSFVLGDPAPAAPGTGSGAVFEDQVADFCARNGGCPW